MSKKKESVWTQFWDMSSGGSQKESFHYCYIEAPEDEAVKIFYNRFGHNPNRVTCTCCGGDYSIQEYKSLREATAYHRGCRYDAKRRGYVEEPDAKRSWQRYLTLEDYMNDPEVLYIFAKDVKPEERQGEVPEEGYVWV